MEAESSVRFAHVDVPAGHVHPGGFAQQGIPAAGMMHPNMGAFLAGLGMAPTGFFLPGRPPASAVYGADAANAPRNVWNGMLMMAGQQHQAGGGGNGGEKPLQQQKGPWTPDEDQMLKHMVSEHGERKWAVIAKFLPGRIGKQCRERWTNHLRPDIKKSVWTQADDELLIQGHKMYGNRWSLIAKFIPGRSENAVKNHWNATRRSLKAKRRLRKRRNSAQQQQAEEQHPARFSLLENYIRSVYPTAADLTAPAPAAPPVSPPSTYSNMGYGDGEVVSPPSSATPPPPTGVFDPAAGMGMMYLNSGGSSSSASPQPSNVGAAMNVPPMMLDLNAFCGWTSTPMKPQVMMDHDQQQEQQASSYYPSNNLMIGYHPLVDNNFMWQQPSSMVQAANNANNAGGGHHQYYGGSAGPSGSGGADDVDVVQMASREFLMPSQDEVTLDLARFM